MSKISCDYWKCSGSCEECLSSAEEINEYNEYSKEEWVKVYEDEYSEAISRADMRVKAFKEKYGF